MDEHADIMTDDLAQHLVYHGDRRLAAHIVSELSLDHAESALNVAALVIVREEVHPT